MKEHIHIISFDIPYPANYGGAIDVFYKIKSLSDAGVSVILHCFVYNNKQTSKELEKICEKVYYYKRDTSLTAQISYLPYTVFSRKNNDLLKNLNQDNYPVLFEGLMSCYYINHKSLKNRIKLVRECNIEHKYYYKLFQTATSPIKRLFYLTEAIKLKIFEKNITQASHIFAISATEQQELKQRYPSSGISFVPCFHSNNNVSIKPGKSDYILYHGNLSVSENELAALYLTKEVFPKLPIRCVIAGMKPSEKLRATVKKQTNTILIANPEESEMGNLIANAQINILITQQTTGLKIKLLNALFSGRHIVVNNGILEGSGLDELCKIANTAHEQISACKSLLEVPFTEKMIEERRKRLIPAYSNRFQTEFIIDTIRQIRMQ